MIRKFAIVLVPFLLVSVQSKAQSVQIDLNYQSFMPFIHFQLRFGNHRRHYSRAYRGAYLRGYMDGVNNHYYYRQHYRRMERTRRAYKIGYHDGFNDRGLLIRLRGRDWLRHYLFSRHDYDSPTVSIRLWLNRLSHVFHGRRWQHKGHHRDQRWWGRSHRRHHYHRGYHHRHRYYRGDDDWEDFHEDWHEDFDEDDD